MKDTPIPDPPSGEPPALRARAKPKLGPSTAPKPADTVNPPSQAVAASPARKSTRVAVTAAKGVGRTVYFRDEEMVAFLDQLKKRYPRASTSAIINQLLQEFRVAYDRVSDTGNKPALVVSFTGEVVLS